MSKVVTLTAATWALAVMGLMGQTTPQLVTATEVTEAQATEDDGSFHIKMIYGLKNRSLRANWAAHCRVYDAKIVNFLQSKQKSGYFFAKIADFLNLFCTFYKKMLSLHTD